MRILQLEIDADGVGLISINDPARPMNVTCPEFNAELEQIVRSIASDKTIRGAIITSGKSNAFIAGGDIKQFVTAHDSGMTLEDAVQMARSWNQVMRQVETCGKPVAAAINGLALGGGLEIALCCHYRVLADDAKTLVGLPECTIGLLPGGGGTQRLPRLIGGDKAIGLILEGKRLKPAEALELGMVNELAPRDQVVEVARRWILSNPAAIQPWDLPDHRPVGLSQEWYQSHREKLLTRTQGNYPAPVAALASVYEGSQLPFDQAMAIEERYFAELLIGPVARNLMRTSFISKGEADKLIRRPAGPAKTSVRTLGVIGAGMMGAGIAHVAAAAGISVILLDTELTQAEKGKAYSAQLLQKDIERGRSSQDKATQHLARIQPSDRFASLAECDLVVEAVFENRAVKAEVTQRAEEAITPAAVFASNTSTLPITGLAQASQRPENFVGIHFFSPVHLMPLVEIIVGTDTSEETIAKAMDFVGQLRKTPIIVNDSPGFYANRVFIGFVDEAMIMLGEGVAPEAIEQAAKEVGMPVGPLAITDEVSVELQWKVARQAEEDGLEERFRRLDALPVIRRMTQELGRLGRKSGGGFYEYPQNAPKHLWPGLAAEFHVADKQPDLEEVKMRLLYIQALEGVRCLEEGVVSCPADADLGAVLGVGFPAWAGGPVSYVETVGLANFVSECERLARTYGPRFEPSAALRERARQNRKFYDAPV